MPRFVEKSKPEPRRWFRFYAESIDDPKVQKLAPHLFKTWVNLLSLACQNGGVLPSRSDIAFRLRMSDHDAQLHLDELILQGLIDVEPSGQMEPHNWKGRQFISDSSAERVRKHRKQKHETARNVTRNDAATPPDAETDTETEDAASAASARERAAAPLPEVSDLKRLSDRLHAEAGPCLANHAVAPGLWSMATPQMWLDQGADLERDVVPVLQVAAARGKRNVASWDYFTRGVAEAKAKRIAGLPSVDVATAPFARKRLDLSKLKFVEFEPEVAA